MKAYLLDTNVISEMRKNKPHGAVAAWMNSLQPTQIFLSAVTLAELQVGVELTRKQNPSKAAEIEAWVDELAQRHQVIAMDTSCFREWARQVQNKPVEIDADAMLAATARIHRLIIATRNEADFQNFDIELVNPFKFEAHSAAHL